MPVGFGESRDTHQHCSVRRLPPHSDADDSDHCLPCTPTTVLSVIVVLLLSNPGGVEGNTVAVLIGLLQDSHSKVTG